jgi:2-iminobutanoate/2-iminopropanoate deaminase
MTRSSINIEGIHHAGLPIPQASRVGPLLITGGINGMDRTTGEIPAELETQVALIFDNIRSLVELGGGTIEDIAKVTFHTTDKSCRPLIDAHWSKMFPNPESRPARHTLNTTLNGPMLIQAEFIAFVKENAA